MLSGTPRAEEPISPIPPQVAADPEKVKLGRALFHDPLLSKDGTISCASCHDLAAGGADGRKISIGIEGKPGKVNAPTVFNAGMNFKQFWDGRASTLEPSPPRRGGLVAKVTGACACGGDSVK